MVTTRPPILPDPERQAQEVAERFTADLGRLENLESSRSSETRYSLLADVEFAIEELRYVLLWANHAGVPVPCIRDGEDTVPIVGLPPSPAILRRFPPGYFPPYPYPSFLREPFFYESFAQAFSRSEIVLAKPSEVPEMVSPPLTKFLTVRFQWIADNPEFRSVGAASSAQANTPYLPFTVYTNTSGLRIHYSKTFAINFNNVFGAPTTPLNGWILPGIHKFAGVDGSGNFHYDTGTFTTPPDFTAQLMI
jgi:hypothetical protein